MKMTSLALLAAIASLAAGCQTFEQRVEARSKLVCFQAGYGATSPKHQECMETLKPVAIDMERQAALRQISDGLATAAAGFSRDGVTCIDYGSAVRCR